MTTYTHENDSAFLDKHGYLVIPAVDLTVDVFSGMVLSYEITCKVIGKLGVTPESPK